MGANCELCRSAGRRRFRYRRAVYCRLWRQEHCGTCLRALDVGPAWAQSDGPRDEKRHMVGLRGRRVTWQNPRHCRNRRCRRRVMPHRCGVRDELHCVEPKQRCLIAFLQRSTAQTSLPRRRCSIASYRFFGYDEQNGRCPVSAVDETRGNFGEHRPGLRGR